MACTRHALGEETPCPQTTNAGLPPSKLRWNWTPPALKSAACSVSVVFRAPNKNSPAARAKPNGLLIPNPSARKFVCARNSARPRMATTNVSPGVAHPKMLSILPQPGRKGPRLSHHPLARVGFELRQDLRWNNRETNWKEPSSRSLGFSSSSRNRPLALLCAGSISRIFRYKGTARQGNRITSYNSAN